MTPAKGLTRPLTQEEYDKILEFVEENLEQMQSHNEKYEKLPAIRICLNFFNIDYGDINKSEGKTVRINLYRKNKIPKSLQDFIQKELGISLEM